MASTSAHGRVFATRDPVILQAVKQTLFLWFVFAGAILLLVYESGTLNDSSGYLTSITAMSVSDYHRQGRSLQVQADKFEGYIGRGSLSALKGEGKLDRLAIGPKSTEHTDKVHEKIRKRKESREKIELRHLEEEKELASAFDFSPKDFSSYPLLPSLRVLPDMSTEKGGVIFFLHVPKTGGQTIRHSFGFKWIISRTEKQKVLNELKNNGKNLNMDLLETPALMQKVRFVMANRLDVFLETAVPKINRFLSGTTNHGKILLCEVHGMDNKNALELEPYLQAWRQRSRETNIPFFTFTVLREAVSEQVSFFNFYFIHPGDPRFCDGSITTSTRCRKQTNFTHGEDDDARIPDEDKLIESTLARNAGIDLDDAMERSIYSNPQCLFLARGERTYGSNATDLRRNLGQDECDATYQSLRRTMDWIGRTDTLTSETLPLLTTMMFQKPSIGSGLQKSNESPKKKGFVVVTGIQERTRKVLEESSRIDQHLYQRVARDYRVDQWVNYKRQ